MTQTTIEEQQDLKKETILRTPQSLDVISDIPLEIKCILGSATIKVNQLLKLSKGSVIELDRNVGEPIDIFVNGKLLAKGEVVIVEEKIGITLTEIVKE